MKEKVTKKNFFQKIIENKKNVLLLSPILIKIIFIYHKK